MSIVERVQKRLKDCNIQEITELSVDGKIVTLSCLTQSKELQVWQVANIIKQSNELETLFQNLKENNAAKKETLCQNIKERLYGIQMLSGSFCSLVLLDDVSKKKLEETLQEPYIIAPQQFFFSDWTENDIYGVDLYMQLDMVASLEMIQKYKVFSEDEIIKIGLHMTKAVINFQQIQKGFVGVTPASICYTSNGMWKLQDKKISMIQDKNTFANQSYFAPEETKGVQEEKTDIYRIGRILQILCTNSQMSYHLKSVLEIACRKNANERYKNIEVFKYSLEECYKTCEQEKRKKEEAHDQLILELRNKIQQLTNDLSGKQVRLTQTEQKLTQREMELQQKAKQLVESEEKNNLLKKEVEEKEKENSLIRLQLGVVQLESNKKDEKIASLETQLKNQTKVGSNGTTTTVNNDAVAKQYNATASTYYDKNNYAEALKWYKKSAELGNTYAQSWVGFMYQNGKGVTQNYGEAKKWYEMAANKGDDYSQNNLGEFYYYGRGVTKNYTEAIKWYEKAANQGNTSSQNSLGYMYKNGTGVIQNYAEAAKWYRKAAEKGNQYAQNNLANMYFNGNGVAKNYEEAKKWYEKSANQGNINSQSWMGYLYEFGNGVTKNPTEAFKWYSKAAEKEDAYSQKKLGDMYRFGNGVSKNAANAKKWYQKAANNGNEDAKKALKEMK